MAGDVCSIVGCDQPAKALGLCHPHYKEDRLARIAGLPTRAEDEARPVTVRAVRGDYDAARRVTLLRLAAISAAAHLERALVLMDYGADPGDLIRAALEELDPTRKDLP